jgi:hypothetical protein
VGQIQPDDHRQSSATPDCRVHPNHSSHYCPEVIRELCSSIPAPDADSVEALVLYLIIFHALSVGELQHAQIPNFYPLHKRIASPALTEAYYIRVPGPPQSQGDHSPGRSDIQEKFPIEAASWLNPMLERYEHHHRQIVKNPYTRYLICSPLTSPFKLITHLHPLHY